MKSSVTLSVNGQPVSVPEGSVVAAAVASAGVFSCRRSVTGQPRGPLCGIGICFECRVIIDGRRHCKSCQILCRNGMQVETDG
jgi:sarcosine oxidase subunit alpha